MLCALLAPFFVPGCNPSPATASPEEGRDVWGVEDPNTQASSASEASLAEDAECTPTKPCPEGQACEGLLRDERGVCALEEHVKAECSQLDNAEWGKWGDKEVAFCNLIYPDAGEACVDGSECAAGVCLADGMQGEHGECQKYKIRYGCYLQMTNGRVGQKICVN